MINHNVMMLATVGNDGRPSVRAVLHKSFDMVTGRLTFFTNYNSRKSREIEAQPHVAIVMYWDRLQRQVRIEGRAERVSESESDAYFRTRPRAHQIGAWASEQSQPVQGPKTLMARAALVTVRFLGKAIERPPHWGGYAVIPHSIEFWQAGEGRIHQRLLYTCSAESESDWTAQWLFP